MIPAIDLKDGRCVRLRQGDMAAETVYSGGRALRRAPLAEQGADLIHVVDLNGAVDGELKNLPQIEAVMKTVSVKVQVGGGIRTIETVRKYLQAGWPESRAWNGSSHGSGNFWLRPVVSFPSDSLGAGCAGRQGGGQGMDHGFGDQGDRFSTELAVHGGCRHLWDIARDGMLNGPNLVALREVVERSSWPVIACSGITRVEDLQAVQVLGPRVEGPLSGRPCMTASWTIAPP